MKICIELWGKDWDRVNELLWLWWVKRAASVREKVPGDREAPKDVRQALRIIHAIDRQRQER